MRRHYPVQNLVYDYLFPHPTPSDPQDFSQFLIRYLIMEVRVETHRFYGNLDTIEAKYPGLDYTYGPHRRRLGRFPHHARLFEAFDALGLTSYEIRELCKWEGTLWARQRYEREEGIKVEDTTGNEIPRWIRPDVRGTCRGSMARSSLRDRVSNAGGRKRKRIAANNSGHQIQVKTDIEVEILNVYRPRQAPFAYHQAAAAARRTSLNGYNTLFANANSQSYGISINGSTGRTLTSQSNNIGAQNRGSIHQDTENNTINMNTHINDQVNMSTSVLSSNNLNSNSPPMLALDEETSSDTASIMTDDINMGMDTSSTLESFGAEDLRLNIMTEAPTSAPRMNEMMSPPTMVPIDGVDGCFKSEGQITGENDEMMA